MPHAAIRSSNVKMESCLLGTVMWRIGELVDVTGIDNCIDVFCWKEVQKVEAVVEGEWEFKVN